MNRLIARLATIAFVLCSLSDLAAARVISSRPTVDTIEVLGWEPSSERIYYLVSCPFPQPKPPADSLRILRYYNTAGSTDQQPHTLMTSTDSQSDKIQSFRQLVKRTRSRLTRMRSSKPVARASVREMNSRVHEGSDFDMQIADYRIESDGLAGAWTSGNVCEGMQLRVDRIHIVRGRRLGVAILESPGPPGCEFARVVLISDRPVPPLMIGWSQTP